MNNSYKKAMDKIELSDELKEKIINNTSKPQANQILKFRPVSVSRIAGLAACFVFCFLSYYAVTNHHVQEPVNIVSVATPAPSPANEILNRTVVATSAPIQKQTSAKAVPDSKIAGSIKTGKEPAVTNPPAYEKAAVNDNQINPISPKPQAEDNAAADNGIPPFAKGKVKNKTDNSASEQLTAEQSSAILGYEVRFPQKAPEGYELSGMSVARGTVYEVAYKSENDIITYRTARVSEDLSQKNGTYEFMEIVNVNNNDIVLKGNEELYYNAAWYDNEESFSITSNNGVEKSGMIDMISSIDYAEQTDN